MLVPILLFADARINVFFTQEHPVFSKKAVAFFVCLKS
jgi:hypothetical protein